MLGGAEVPTVEMPFTGVLISPAKRRFSLVDEELALESLGDLDLDSLGDLLDLFETDLSEPDFSSCGVSDFELDFTFSPAILNEVTEI